MGRELVAGFADDVEVACVSGRFRGGSAGGVRTGAPVVATSPYVIVGCGWRCKRPKSEPDAAGAGAPLRAARFANLSDSGIVTMILLP